MSHFEKESRESSHAKGSRTLLGSTPALGRQKDTKELAVTTEEGGQGGGEDLDKVLWDQSRGKLV